MRCKYRKKSCGKDGAWRGMYGITRTGMSRELYDSLGPAPVAVPGAWRIAMAQIASCTRVSCQSTTTSRSTTSYDPHVRTADRLRSEVVENKKITLFVGFSLDSRN